MVKKKKLICWFEFVSQHIQKILCESEEKNDKNSIYCYLFVETYANII